MRAALTARSLSRWPYRPHFPDVLLMGRQHGNRGSAPVAIALENSTYPRNPPNGASTHGSALGVVGQDIRHGAARSEIYSFSVIYAGPREEHGVPAESSHPRREDRAVLETRSSGEALTPQRSTADGRTRRRTDNLALRSLIGPQAAEPDLIVSSLWPATRPCGSAPGVDRNRAFVSRSEHLPCPCAPPPVTGMLISCGSNICTISSGAAFRRLA